MINRKTTAVRLIPVAGQGASATGWSSAACSGTPVMPVNQWSSRRFVARGGRIPAPLQSLNN